MPAYLVVFLIAVGGFTLLTTYWDMWHLKIPNKFTLPMFAAGLVFQLVFNQWSGREPEIGRVVVGGAGLGSALLAFLIGFGIIFVLWMIGGGGGGDVKLMGALSVWLGFWMTLHVLAVGTAVVMVLSVLKLLWSVMRRGARKTKEKYIATGKETGRESAKRKLETIEEKQGRRLMTFAGATAIATWIVVGWHLYRTNPFA